MNFLADKSNTFSIKTFTIRYAGLFAVPDMNNSHISGKNSVISCWFYEGN